MPNTHGTPTREAPAWWGDSLQPYVHSGGLPVVPTTALTVAAFACQGYVRGAAGELVFVDQAAAAVGDLDAGDGTYWLALSRDPSTAVASWTRQAGTHYCWRLAATQPAMPVGLVRLARVVVVAGIITTVADFRRPASYARSGVYDVTDALYGAIGRVGTDDHVAIQSAMDAVGVQGGGTVWFPVTTPACTYDLGTTGLVVQYNGVRLHGERVTLKYTGTGTALDGTLLGSTVYPNQCHVEGITIALGTADGAIAVNWRFSHSTAQHLEVVLAGINQRGIQLPGQDTGTGPYYNTLYDYAVQGTSAAGQKGLWMTWSAAGLAPNANTFVGGRVGQCATNYQVSGGGNRFFSPTSEGATSKHFRFVNDVSAVGCFDNTVFGPYIEGAITSTAVEFTTNALRCTVLYPLITGVAVGLSDLAAKSQGNSFILDQYFTSPTFAAGDYTGNGALTWTVAVGDVSTYAYSLNGRILTVSFALLATTVGGTPDTTLQLKIPAGYVSKKIMFGTFTYSDNSSTVFAVGTTRVDAGGTVIGLYRTPYLNATWSASADLTNVLGTVSFEVQ